MRKTLCLTLCLSFFLTCGPKQNDVERVIEDGVEVVLNSLVPFESKTAPSDFYLQEEFTIDFGSKEIGELGIADAMDFEIDSKACIYFFYPHKQDDLIFKFTANGQFIKSWGRRGQGPGEMQFIISTYLTAGDDLIISDHSNRRILWFSNEGELLNEIDYSRRKNYRIVYPLGNNRFVGYLQEFNAQEPDYFDFVFDLLDQDFEVLNILDVYKYPNPMIKGRRGVNINSFFKAKRSGNYIYVGNEDKGYEIQKFDLQGNLLQRIRKEYTPVKAVGEIIKKRKESTRPGSTTFFPEYYLPICDFFLDDNQRLYIMTFEEGDITGEYWFDIFNSEGILINRKTLPILSGGEIFAFAKIKNNRLYCFQDKEDGYRIFKVYKMSWE